MNFSVARNSFQKLISWQKYIFLNKHFWRGKYNDFNDYYFLDCWLHVRCKSSWQSSSERNQVYCVGSTMGDSPDCTSSITPSSAWIPKGTSSYLNFFQIICFMIRGVVPLTDCQWTLYYLLFC